MQKGKNKTRVVNLAKSTRSKFIESRPNFYFSDENLNFFKSADIIV